MKPLLNIFLGIILLITASCKTQRLVQEVSDAKKLELSKERFINKPLKTLLSQIKPGIKFVYGNPENNSGHITGGTYLTLTFETKEEGKKRLGSGEKPTRVNILFQLEPKNNRKPLPAGGLTKWTKNETKEYGDMIILNINVTGKN